jgi:hypothetical protein
MKPRNELLVYRFFCGRWARRAYVALFFLVLVFSAAVRLRTFLLTRQIHAVLSGLQQVHVDTTTEKQLLKTVPSLLSVGEERHTQSGVERRFHVKISNRDDIDRMGWAPGFLYSLWPARIDVPVRSTWDRLDFPFKMLY